MGDGDATKKTAFEPPPWEQEAFEALAARRAEEQAERDALRMAEAAAPRPPLGHEDLTASPAESVAASRHDGDGDEAAPAPAPATAVDDRAVAAMLLQLQNEERTDGRAARRIGRIAAIFTAVLGVGMLIAGVVMMQSGGGKQVAVIGSAVLSIFGLAFIGMAAWVWITTTRSKGRR